MGLFYLFTNRFYFLFYMKLKLKFLGFLQHGSLHKSAFESQQAQAISLLPIIRVALGTTHPSIRNVSVFLRKGVGGKRQDRIATYIHLVSRLRQWPPTPTPVYTSMKKTWKSLPLPFTR